MTSDERAGGTFVYHPLLPGSDLHELWRASRSGIAAPPAPPSEPLARQYQAHLRARLRTTPGGDAVAVPAHLEEDDRPLVHRFRTFLPVLLDHCGAPPEVAGNDVHFPSIRFFDARAVERGDERATFVTSRVVDAVELFARTMSMCARLNGLAMGELLAAEDPPPEIVALAWMAFTDDGLPGFAVDQVDGAFATPDPAPLLRADLQPSSYLPPDAGRAMTRWRLAHYVAQTMLFGLEHLVEGRIQGADAWLECARPPQADAPMTIDATYLASLVLAFIAVHEQAHVLHNHNSFEPAAGDPQIDAIVEGALRFAAEDERVTAAQDLRGSTLQLEQDADCFPLEVAPDDCRDALLEASSLWLAALAAADRGGHDWLEASTAGKGRVHPQYAMRVWFINGRYSSGSRAGQVALAARRTAEAIEGHPSVQGRYGPDEVLRVFRALWAIAGEEVGEQAGRQRGRRPRWWPRR